MQLQAAQAQKQKELKAKAAEESLKDSRKDKAPTSADELLNQSLTRSASSNVHETPQASTPQQQQHKRAKPNKRKRNKRGGRY